MPLGACVPVPRCGPVLSFADLQLVCSLYISGDSVGVEAVSNGLEVVGQKYPSDDAVGRDEHEVRDVVDWTGLPMVGS